MNKLRGVVAKILIIFLFSLLILSFAFWGIGDMFRGNLSEANVAEVGDKEISQSDFRRAFANEFGRLQRRFGGQLDVQTAQAIGLTNQVLSQLVNQALFDQNTREFKLQVTDEQVRAEILTFPAFLDPAGNFNRALYEQTLASSRMSEAEFVANLRADIARTQISSAMTDGVAPPKQLVDKLYRFQNETRIADYLLVKNSRFEDLALPDAAELNSFYEENKNRYMAPDYRAVTLVQLRPDGLVPDMAVSEDDLREEYQARIADYTVPERRTVRQILFPSEAEALAGLDRLTEGLSYDALAEDVTGEPAISLGTVSQDELTGDMAAVTFSLAEGEISTPVQSPFGWHLMQVTKIEKGSQKSFDQVRGQIEENLRRSKAIDATVDLANQVDDELGGGATVAEAANKFSLPIQTIASLDREGRDNKGELVDNLPQTPDFLAVAFSTAVGEQSLLVETGDGGYFMLQVTSETPASPRPFDQVETQVGDAWIKQEQARRAEELADDLAGKVDAGAALGDLAAEVGLDVQTTPALTRAASDPFPELTGSLFDAKVGAAVVASAQEGTLVAVLKEIIPANPNTDSDGVAQLREQLKQSLQGDLSTAYRQGLLDRYQVQVNPQVVDSALAQF
tara:strand:- start:2021 stop:3892 length:1872 start_codon:yes stop_codon:yes gene_type:complete